MEIAKFAGNIRYGKNCSH